MLHDELPGALAFGLRGDFAGRIKTNFGSLFLLLIHDFKYNRCNAESIFLALDHSKIEFIAVPLSIKRLFVSILVRDCGVISLLQGWQPWEYTVNFLFPIEIIPGATSSFLFIFCSFFWYRSHSDRLTIFFFALLMGLLHNTESRSEVFSLVEQVRKFCKKLMP
jgi:hypothetical protein